MLASRQKLQKTEILSFKSTLKAWHPLKPSNRKFYSNPTDHPDFIRIQAEWYSKLGPEFEEIEDIRISDRPLKRWSGSSSYRDERWTVQTFPKGKFDEEERFSHHPEFDWICKKLCTHGNSRLDPEKVHGIWKDYCQGGTTRGAEEKYGVSDTSAFRVIHRIKEWMSLMDTRDENEEKEMTLILRAFNPERDSPFIYSTWRNAVWYGEKRDQSQSSLFFSKMTAAIKELFGNSETLVKIACDQEDPDYIAGYSVFTGSKLEFIYVKINYRRKGIGKLLSQGFQTIAEPLTSVGKKIAEQHGLKIGESNGRNQKQSNQESSPRTLGE